MKFLVPLALLAVSLFSLVPGSVAAAPQTPDSLTKMLPSKDQAAAALVGTGLEGKLTSVKDEAASNDPVGVARSYSMSDDSIISIIMFSLTDGSEPSGSLREGILNGEFIRATAKSFEPFGMFETDPGSADDSGVLAFFTGKADGKDVTVLAGSFIQGNVFGLIWHATTSGEPDLIGLASVAEALRKNMP